MGWNEPQPNVNYRPATSIGIPTYEGTPVATEPCVRYFPNKWNGWRYWMAMVPFLHGDASENPSIIVSGNGVDWQVPVGLTNPVVPYPGGGVAGINADPCINLDATGTTMWLSWLVGTASDGSNGFYVKSSTDGVTWSASTKLVGVAVSGYNEPKVIWDGTQWRCYQTVQGTNQLIYSTNSTVSGTGWSTTTACTIPIPDGTHVWHMDIIREPSGRWVMPLVDDDDAGTYNKKCWMASSWDGVTWKVSAQAFMFGGAALGGWTSSGMYRPTIQRLGNTHYGCWVGGVGPDWRIGYTTIPAWVIP